MGTKRKVIIDADSLCYMSSKGNVYDSIEVIDSRIQEIIEVTEATDYTLVLSEGKYFRHEVNPDYKGNRKGRGIPTYTKTLKEYIKADWGALSYKEVEADDIASYYKFNDTDNEMVIATADKDVLKQIPGSHYNYGKGEWVETDLNEAFMFLWLQTLTGDHGDNIKGIKGVGPKKARDMINDFQNSEDLSIKDLAGSILKIYLHHFPEPGQSIYEFQKNFRQVYLLRTDEDFMQEVGYIPKVEFKSTGVSVTTKEVEL